MVGGDSVDRLPVDVSGDATESVRFSVLTRSLRNATGIEAVAFYRGHVRECPCRFPPDEGWDVEYVPLRTFAPKITVTGAARDDQTVVFILDCSKSMLQQVGGTEGASSRIRVARDVLKDILTDLVRRDPSLRIGVMIYSRRAEWGRDAQGNIVAIQRTTTQVHPCADVEWLFRPGRLTERDKQQVFDELDESQPGGSTPLYLSIVKAIREYRLDEKSRHIVVITDGMNDQLSTLPMPDKIDGIAARQDLDDVRAELQRAGNVRLDVIGFDLSPDTMMLRTSRAIRRSGSSWAIGSTTPRTRRNSRMRSLGPWLRPRSRCGRCRTSNRPPSRSPWALRCWSTSGPIATRFASRIPRNRCKPTSSWKGTNGCGCTSATTASG